MAAEERTLQPDERTALALERIADALVAIAGPAIAQRAAGAAGGARAELEGRVKAMEGFSIDAIAGTGAELEPAGDGDGAASQPAGV